VWTSAFRRRWVRWLIVALVLFLAFLGATVLLFIWPRTDGVARLPAGLRLMREHVARVLVLGTAPKSPLCHGAAPYEVVCFQPKPFSTRGEARFVAALAARRGWHRLELVTSRWHVTRARLLLRRCYHGRVRVVGAKPRDDLPQLTEDIVHEWGGLVYALTLARGC
jgi:DUF218 domain